jgi:hypothetical protein
VETHDGRFGTVEQVLLDHNQHVVMHFVVRPDSALIPRVVVPIDWVRGIDHNSIFMDANREQIEQMPEPSFIDDQDLDDSDNDVSTVDESRSSQDPVSQPQHSASPTGLDYLWVQQFLFDSTGMHFDSNQVEELVEHAERKLRDLIDLGKDTALANGRELIFWYDIPLTPGLRAFVTETEQLTKKISVDTVEDYLRLAGILSRFDDQLREKLPRLLGGLLILTGRITTILTPRGMSPSERTAWLSTDREPVWPFYGELERAMRIVDIAV